MKVVSVNVGKAQKLADAKPGGATGIYKVPSAGPVFVRALGIDGDAVCDKKHHGGPDQAVYVYAQEDYEWWSDQLGKRLAPGTFGDNITTQGFDANNCLIGDILTMGDVVLQVTSPRIPCVTLSRRMEDREFVKAFSAARRPGAYCRVLREGSLGVETPIGIQRFDGEPVTNLEVFDDFYKPVLTLEAINRFLNAPIAIRARTHKESQLAGLA